MAKKAPAKKAPAKKAPAKKPVAKKAPAKKAPAKKAPAKKTPAKKPVDKKAPAKKAPAKKAPAKKAPAKKAPAKKAEAEPKKKRASVKAREIKEPEKKTATSSASMKTPTVKAMSASRSSGPGAILPGRFLVRGKTTRVASAMHRPPSESRPAPSRSGGSSLLAKKLEGAREAQKKPEPEHKVGHAVVHPSHGVGVVKEISEQRISGRLNRYYVIEFPLNELDCIMVPVENASSVGLRKVADKKLIEEMLTILADTEGKFVDYMEDESFHKRHKEYVDRVQSGDLLAVAKVFKTLYERSREKELGLKEKFLMERAEKMLVGELSFARKISFDKAQSLIDANKI